MIDGFCACNAKAFRLKRLTTRIFPDSTSSQSLNAPLHQRETLSALPRPSISLFFIKKQNSKEHFSEEV
ncbi:hypothetical protein [Acetobacter malorum]|uniref:hypothetical protein n=1 Tax=Acetobacter malorum TaxID=178901 RepID=UPI0012E938AF|nr:hypothetical protein [Acetobacter malorum]